MYFRVFFLQKFQMKCNTKKLSVNEIFIKVFILQMVPLHLPYIADLLNVVHIARTPEVSLNCL